MSNDDSSTCGVYRNQDAALAAARGLCERRGERWTPLRERALTAVLEADGPVKAYDLLPALGSNDSPAKPATAYRALEFLEQLGLVHRIEALNAFIYCTHGGGEHATALYICSGCDQTFEVALDHNQARKSAPSGFMIERTVTEIYGRCQNCARQ
jgi:Fur family zinc uptake transcriptional regulator